MLSRLKTLVKVVKALEKEKAVTSSQAAAAKRALEERAERPPPPINRGGTAEPVALTEKALGKRLPTGVVEPHAALKEALQGVVSDAGMRRALKVANSVISDDQAASNLATGFQMLARRGAKSMPTVNPVAPPDASSPYANLGTATFDELQKTRFAPVVKSAADGVSVVVASDTAKPGQLAELEKLYGAKVLLADPKHSGPPLQVPGVALHVGMAQELSKAVVGDHNPLLGDAQATRFLEDNKYREALLAGDGFMPATVNGKDLIDRDPVFVQHRKSALEAMKNFDVDPSSANEKAVRDTSTGLYRHFLDASRQLFPAGAFVKLIGEFQTGDKGQMLTTANTRAPGRAIVADLKKARAEAPDLVLGGKAYQKQLDNAEHRTTQLVKSLLYNPDNVMVQEAVALGKTPDGKAKEIRVDMASGVVVNSSPRYGYAYMPDEQRSAADFVEKFVKHTGLNISGGVDVGFLENGDKVILELNVGAQSSFIDPRSVVLEGNQTISRLKGGPTPMMQMLEEKYRGGVSEQVKMLSSLKDVESDTRAGLHEMGILAPAAYFRNRTLEAWQADPTLDNAQKAWRDVQAMLEPLKDRRPEDYRALMDTTRSYLEDQRGMKLSP